ncbi:MAG: hypothetical protein V4520_02120 [Bacteroidota bacterium]
MKRIYIAATVLIAVAITEGCIKQRVAETRGVKHSAAKRTH